MDERLRTGVNRCQVLTALGAAAVTVGGSVSAAPKTPLDFWRTPINSSPKRKRPKETPVTPSRRASVRGALGCTE